VAGSCGHGNEPLGSKKAGNFLAIRETVGFSERTLPHGVR
jgi:hypothetical protein